MSDETFFDFTIEEAAKYLRLKKAYLYQNIRSIKHYKVGGRLFFQKEDLHAWMAKHIEGDGAPITPSRGRRVPSV